MFGSIGTHEIAAAITAAGQDVEKSEVALSEGAIHETGEFAINLQFHSDVTASITLTVTAAE